MSATSRPFIDSLPEGDRRDVSRLRTFWRPALSLFYGGLIVSAAVIIVVIRTAPTHKP